MFKKFVFVFIILSLNIIYFNFINAQVINRQNLFSVDANTVALWRFNDLSGNVVTDETGVNNGTTIGTTITDGKFGKSRYFNGVSDYIKIPHSSILTNFSQLSIEAWIYPTDFDLGCWNQNEGIVFKGVETPPAIIDYALRIDRNTDTSCGSATSFRQLKFSGEFDGASVVSPVWHEPNQWYYVVFTYDGSYLKLYVNGNLEAISSYAPNLTASTTYPLYINHHTWNYEYSNSQRIQGLIDEIRISNITRSQEEISYYYNLATSIQMIKPTVDGTIKRGFGICPDPKTNKTHEGVDIDRLLDGTSVKAVAPGTVVRIDLVDDSKAGKWIWIYHGNVSNLAGEATEKISTRYLHLDTVEPSITVGQVVSQDTVIGTIGKTGATTPHLHFEIRQGDIPPDFDFSKTTALDPLYFVEYPLSPQSLSIFACSPVNLIITDPDGLIISKDINELSSLSEYYEVKYLGGSEDGEETDFDLIFIQSIKIGDYFITVMPESQALPIDTFTLQAISNGNLITLVEHALIDDIPDQSFIVRSTTTTIEKIIPAKIKIEPETLNLNNKGFFTAFIEFFKIFKTNINDIDPQTVKINSVVAAKTIINENKLIAKFNTQDFSNLPTGEEVVLRTNGKLLDEIIFEGSDKIRIIKK